MNGFTFADRSTKARATETLWEWTEPLSALRAKYPELYKKVMAKHLFDDCIEYRKEYLKLKYPPEQEQSPTEEGE